MAPDRATGRGNIPRQRHGRLALWAVVAGLVLGAGLSAGGPVPGSEPATALAAPGPIMWGAYIDGAPFDPGALSRFESDAGRHVSIVHWGEPWMSGGNAQPFQTSAFDTVRKHGSIPMLTWGSWDYCCGANQSAWRLARVSGGSYDGLIKDWARAAAAWGQPFFLRFDPEMNGDWLPWSERVNGNHAGEFVKAWRHVHDLFVQAGATNATWVWCPNTSYSSSTPLAELYPGDSYVDWTCMDGYNFGTDRPGEQWQTFAQVFSGSALNASHNTYQELLSLAPKKPIMIGEIATSKRGGDSATWIADALGTQLPQHFPQVKALVWFNWNAGDASQSWPIETLPAAARTAFTRAIRSGYYTANGFASLGGRTIAPYAGGSPEAAPPPPPAPAPAPAAPPPPAAVAPPSPLAPPDPGPSAADLTEVVAADAAAPSDPAQLELPLAVPDVDSVSTEPSDPAAPVDDAEDGTPDAG